MSESNSAAEVRTGYIRAMGRVPLDKSEGVVKRHFFAAMLCSTAWLSEWWRTEALKLSR
jgi:hypothetical protein